MSFRTRVTTLALGAAVSAAFGALMASTAAADHDPRPAYAGVSVKTITATLTGADGQEVGQVQVNEDASGVVQIHLGVSNLTPGAHGIHLHAVGKCEAPGFLTAGGHFNPAGASHGLHAPTGHHAGDLPNLIAEPNGTSLYTTTTADVSITGGTTNIFDIDGTALVIHAGPDDQVTDPTGNSGARVACAVLAAANPALATPTPTPTVTQAAPTATPGAPATGSDGPAAAGASGRTLGLAFLAVALASVSLAIAARKRFVCDPR